MGEKDIQLKLSGWGISKIKNWSVFWLRDPTSCNIFERNMGRIYQEDINTVNTHPT